MASLMFDGGQGCLPRHRQLSRTPDFSAKPGLMIRRELHRILHCYPVEGIRLGNLFLCFSICDVRRWLTPWMKLYAFPPARLRVRRLPF